MSQIFGYCRVSTSSQDYTTQQNKILEYCKLKNLPDPLFKCEVISSSKNKEKIKEFVSTLKETDSLIVTELSRLGRSMSELSMVVNILFSKKIPLHIVNSDLVLVGDNMSSQIWLFVFGMAAEIERSLISERTIAALKVRKESGMKLGRPAGKCVLDKYEEEIKEFVSRGFSAPLIRNELKLLKNPISVSEGTILSFIQKKKLKYEGRIYQIQIKKKKP